MEEDLVIILLSVPVFGIADSRNPPVIKNGTMREHRPTVNNRSCRVVKNEEPYGTHWSVLFHKKRQIIELLSTCRSVLPPGGPTSLSPARRESHLRLERSQNVRFGLRVHGSCTFVEK